MEEASVKKEIVVKRLSAFKFAVEVNTKEDNAGGARVSVIQKAPPASPVNRISSSTALVSTSIPSDAIPIRQVIMQRIMEILLWKLLGEERLKCCGYPAAPACALLRRVVQLSNIDQKPFVAPAAPCDGSMACFIEQVNKFLNICAPNEEHWSRFGWKALSEEAILRKIYQEQLSPNLRSHAVEEDKNISMIFEDLKMLCYWESQGFTFITKRPAETQSPVLVTARAVQRNQHKIHSRLEDQHVMDPRTRMWNWGSHSSLEWSRPDPWIRQPRPHRVTMPGHKILRFGPEPVFRIHHRLHPTSRRQY